MLRRASAVVVVVGAAWTAAAAPEAARTSSPSGSLPRRANPSEPPAGHRGGVGPAASAASAPAAAREVPPADPRRATAPAGAVEPAVFFGESYPPAPPAAPFGRVGSLGYGTWIYGKPTTRTLVLGSIRPADALPLADGERLPGGGRCGAFVRVAGGFVCATRRATLDEASPWLQAGRWTAPAPGPWPYQYAVSFGAPMLKRLPRAGEALPPVGAPHGKLTGWHEGHDALADPDPIAPNGPVPEPLLAGDGSLPTPWGKAGGLVAKRIPRGSMLAYTRAFEWQGEVFVLSTDLTVVPARGLRGFRRSAFQGVELGGAVRLPVAWARGQGAARYQRVGTGVEALPPERALPPRTWVALTGAHVRHGKRTYWETRDGTHVDAGEVSVVEAATRVPAEAQGAHGRWMYVRRKAATLTLYEGAEPVFTTLISPGRDGATPTGRFFVEEKHHVSTMSGESGDPRQFWVSEVPWTMYFDRPFAVHGAYWHENFGEPMSGGCVNLSPLDAARVFAWAPPELPTGWGSAEGWALGARAFVLIKD